jgi:hypothetical protein
MGPASASSPGSISGVVTDEAEQPLANINVVATYAGGGPGGSARTDDAGAYRISELWRGNYWVEFADGNDPPRYVSEIWNDKHVYDPNDTVRVASGQDVVGIDASLSLGGAISGKVTDATGNPLGGIDVSLYPESGQQSRGTTRVDGTYRFGVLAAGGYRVGFNVGTVSPDFFAEYYSDKPDLETSDVVVVNPGADTSGIDAALRGIIHDLAVTSVTVDGATADQDVANLFHRSVRVTVKNLGNANVDYGDAVLMECGRTREVCHTYDETSFDLEPSLEPGASREVVLDWYGAGWVGDVDIRVDVRTFHDSNSDNNFGFASTSVLVEGSSQGVGPGDVFDYVPWWLIPGVPI